MLVAIKNQCGTISVAALILMLALLAVVTAYAKQSMEGFSAAAGGYRYPDEIAAQQAAVAGIYYVLAHAKQNSPDRDWDTTTLARNQWISVGNGTFSIDVEQLIQLPAGISGGYYRVTATGICNQSRRVVQAYLNVPPEQNNRNPLDNARFSGQAWTVDTTTGIARSPSSTAYDQALFDDQLYANDAEHPDQNGKKGFTLQYRVRLNSNNPGAAGYGIIYLANGDPKNYSGYVLQYDPGLNYKIVVKKVVAGQASIIQPELNEIHFYNGRQYCYVNNSPNDNAEWMKNTNQSWQASASPSWSLNSRDLSNSADVMTINMDTILARLQTLGTVPKTTTRRTWLTQEHTFDIDVRPDSSGRVVHSIRVDGLGIIKFIDNDTTYPVFTQGGSGLRVWNGDVDFLNLPGSLGQLEPIRIISWTYPIS
jgi:hypothetical protein